MGHISRSYLAAVRRLRSADSRTYDEKQRRSDREYVDRIHEALGRCTAETRELIRKEYFESSSDAWMYLYFRYSQLKRMKRKALAEFFNNLDL